jgi:hypothetical protein
MTDDAAPKHPARIDELIDALRDTPEGEGIAEGLDFLFDHAPPFKLPRAPRDRWDYVRLLFETFAESADLSSRVFCSPHHAFAVGSEMTEALILHDSVYEPFRRALDDEDWASRLT